MSYDPDNNEKFIFPSKNSNDRLPYLFDFAGLANKTSLEDWLEDGEVIASYDPIIPEGLTLERDDLIFSDTTVLLDISGGTDGEDYEFGVRITTSSSPPKIKSGIGILPIRD